MGDMSLTGRIKIAHGARRAEGLLLRDLGEILEARKSSDRALLPPPVRVIVPSRSLRQHLGHVMVRHFGGSIAGVSIQTLRAVANEIIERAGNVEREGHWIFELLVRRFAKEEESLRHALDHLADGYGTVVPTIVDFLDAGFEKAHAETLEEAIAELPPGVAPAAAMERSRALVRAAARTCEALESHGIGWISSAFRVAASLLRGDPRRILPASAVLIHGFADATGVATDLIEAMVRHCGAWVYLDQPHDPARPGKEDLGVQFTLRFLHRLTGAASSVEELPAQPEPEPEISMIRAAGADAEIREVALRIGALLERGGCPERIGVVARDLTRYRLAIRFHFQRLGIPFSGVGALGPPDGVGRRIQALLELLKRKANSTVDRWLEVLQQPKRPDLRLAFRSLGIVRLQEAASLDPKAVLTDGGDYPLPVRRGLGVEDDAPWDELKVQAPRRRLPGVFLIEAVELAKRAVGSWAVWPEQDVFRSHREALLGLLQEGLLWSKEMPVAEKVLEALEGLGGQAPEGFTLSYDEFVLALSQALREAGVPPIGGAGGGVQVLDVMEARGRTFDHLFIIGLNKDLFPRLVREDPLLPDPVRRALAVLLPDLPIKSAGYEEERYLFAQLISSSPRITVSWQAVQEDGRPVSPSPFLERLRLAKGWEEPRVAPSVYAPPGSRPDPEKDGIRPAQEHAIIAGLYGGRDRFKEILALAVAETHGEVWGAAVQDCSSKARALARARVAVLQEMDPDRGTARGRKTASLLGPYFGFIGATCLPEDPRRSGPFVSMLEQIAYCPWRAFLTRLLRLEPVPDPLEALPKVDELLLGVVVHAIMERVAREAIPAMPRTLEEALESPGVSPSWPDDAPLERIMTVVAERTLREAGIGLSGLARVLEAKARPYIDTARQLDWSEGGGIEFLAAEVQGALSLTDSSGTPRLVRFRADRLDRSGGRLRLTDYKTGRTISDAAGEGTRRDRFLRDVKAGLRLQAMAYVLGAGGGEAEGRYVFLRPGIPEGARVFRVTHEDREFKEAFEEAAKALIEAMDLGVFFPRLAGPDGREEPIYCRHCEAAQACLRGDTGARSRLVRYMEAARSALADGKELASAEKATARLWWLGERATESGEGQG